ncbi:hypothetical protein NC652_008151 [Populus alba x Populus x berolinensis]|nr:hypothetical protein NC652_008151 [Populus alba x Populus x berolinensis]
MAAWLTPCKSRGESVFSLHRNAQEWDCGGADAFGWERTLSEWGSVELDKHHQGGTKPVASFQRDIGCYLVLNFWIREHLQGNFRAQLVCNCQRKMVHWKRASRSNPGLMLASPLRHAHNT